ncbi:SAM-dependent methyltransferase [Kutzneria kofuensis]|uniref:Cyclopropane-fatty-acyl-phospholipid synthase n=1 Tax=Kutzneria kofuensis TaxID=103725 RepID=A0A7W9KM94_9PSEU|nr:cyclopropane-fatty-acyl-phospholipid synthase family protein [Kutzneria kofuensis]MBB5895075.1 cyclopropane-fatty-acyl-phospholipid synthase [Kutzneria kofuensis]
MPNPGVAVQVVTAIETVYGLRFPIGMRAWDGSRAGTPEGPVAVLRSPRAVRQLLLRPGRSGLVTAYVTGHLDIDGDFAVGLRHCRELVAHVRAQGPPRPAHWPRLIGLLARTGIGGRRAPVDASQPTVDFPPSILDDTMARSCGYWTSDGPEYHLSDAQHDKLDLVCRKLGLAKGMRLLDVGCGWGSLVLHAAENHGVAATGVTVSATQCEFVRARAAERGLSDSVTVQRVDPRDIDGEPFDAVASIETGEHVSAHDYPSYCATLRRLLRPGGQLLMQQTSGGGMFTGSYLTPAMATRPVEHTLGQLRDAGLEIKDVMSMREHYVRTIDAWRHALDLNWDDVVTRVGASRARIWRLQLADNALAFADDKMSVHQILAVRR